MPTRAGGLDDAEIAQVGAFMLTMGNPARAKDADITGANAATTEGILGDKDSKPEK